jgi:hypothetical protein
VKKRLSKSSLLPVSPSDADSFFDRRIDLETEGIDSFFGSILKEILADNGLTIVNYVLSMRSEINLSDGYRKLNIYLLYSVSVL